jgi:hypothetical protein
MTADAFEPVAASALTSDKTHLPAASLSRVTPRTRERAAKNREAMPDGSFPVRDGADLRRAIKAFGRAKDKGAAKRHIIRRARALGKTDLLPDAWKALATREFGKRENAISLVAAPAAVEPLELLATKAERYDVSLAKLKVVYDRGLTAASGTSRSCVSDVDLAHARVNAFLLALTEKHPRTCLDFDLLPTSHPARVPPFTNST